MNRGSSFPFSLPYLLLLAFLVQPLACFAIEQSFTLYHSNSPNNWVPKAYVTVNIDSNSGSVETSGIPLFDHQSTTPDSIQDFNKKTVKHSLKQCFMHQDDIFSRIMHSQSMRFTRNFNIKQNQTDHQSIYFSEPALTDLHILKKQKNWWFNRALEIALWKNELENDILTLETMVQKKLSDIKDKDLYQIVLQKYIREKKELQGSIQSICIYRAYVKAYFFIDPLFGTDCRWKITFLYYGNQFKGIELNLGDDTYLLLIQSEGTMEKPRKRTSATAVVYPDSMSEETQQQGLPNSQAPCPSLSNLSHSTENFIHQARSCRMDPDIFQ